MHARVSFPTFRYGGNKAIWMYQLESSNMDISAGVKQYGYISWSPAIWIYQLESSNMDISAGVQQYDYISWSQAILIYQLE
jgi:hypothetical protein